MPRDVANEIYRLLLEKCESRCMDNHEDRKAVAETIASYLQEVDDETGKRSPGVDEPG